MQDEKQIRLRVVSVMTEPDGTRHENQSVHRGTLRAAAEGPEIVYEQVDEGVRARISLTRTADGVQMRRMGEMTGALHFQPGRKTPGLYGTAYGDIPVAVYTREVLVEESEKAAKCGWITMCLSAAERTAATVMTLTWQAVNAVRSKARDAVFAAGGRGFVRFLPDGEEAAAGQRCAEAMPKPVRRCSAHAARGIRGRGSGTSAAAHADG